MEIINKIKGLKLDVKPEEIHGHVCVDLHNHNSGFTERIETDNIVTNALKEALQFVFRGSNLDFFPIASKALGGIMLFDSSLTESSDNVCFPSNAKLIGFAGQGASSSSPVCGSFNAVESGAIDNGYRSVWDFSTSQGNGTIAALSRTHYNIMSGPVSMSNVIKVTANVAKPIPYYYNRNTTRLDCFARKNIYAGKVDLYNVKVNDPYPTISGFYDTGIDLNDISEYDSPINGFDGYIYYYKAYSRTLTWMRWKVSDGSYDKELLVTHNINNPNVTFITDYGVVINGYGYVLSDNRSLLYKVNLNNAADITEIQLPHSNVSRVFATESGVIFTLGGDNLIIYPDNTIVQLQNIQSQIKINDVSVAPKYLSRIIGGAYSKDGSSYDRSYFFLYMFTHYLGTIANISPVVKTATQSMKITYTLTNE